MLNLGKKGGTGACVRCEEAGTRPSARVGLAMSVFTHGVTTKGKPRLINRNQVFTVVLRRKSLSTQRPRGHGFSASPGDSHGTWHFFRKPTVQAVLFRRFVPAYPTKSAVLRP